jgi:asparagine synthase (glutamine-hydrolysing)
MCGVAGFLFNPNGSVDATRALQRMTDALRHRGPDDQGYWINEGQGIALGHRRLSIIDLSPAGHQPMVSHSSRYVLSLNGEIYNYRDLRRELGNGNVWQGSSDTEVLLEAIDRWGIAPALKRVVGMFAFALWDAKTATLTLARDRMGEKPLYFGSWSGSFLFGSELKAFHAFSGHSPPLNRDAVAQYFQQGSVPAPLSIYQNVWKLLPGHFVSLNWKDFYQGNIIQQEYWSVAEALAGPRFKGTAQDAVTELDSRLAEAIRLQSVSDVALGALLSGGIDSSCIVSLMQKHSPKPIRTYSIGFESEKFNEAQHAAAVAKYLGTSHTEFVVTEAETIDVIPSIGSIWDEPFGDSSQIPTYIVMQLARRDVTVALSGDGGDELFLGYSRYETIDRFERFPGTRLLRGVLPVTALDLAETALAKMNLPTSRLRILAEMAAGRSVEERYLAYMFQPLSNASLLRFEIDAAFSASGMPCGRDVLETISAIDAVTYLPNDVLTKVDRAAMSVGLESRAPFLDHRIVEFAFSLPTKFKMFGGIPKWPLRQLLAHHIPPSLTERPKMGFGVPISDWLRGRLKGWAEELLSAHPRDGLLNMQRIERLWRSHQDGNLARTATLWRVLMFLEWCNRYD